MKEQNNPQKKDSLMDQNQPVNQPETMDRQDMRDQQIKNEDDTKRLRSERQSVIDAEEDRNEHRP